MPADKETQLLVEEISRRIEDLYVGNEDAVSSALGLVILKVLNSKYPPDLSEESISLIKGNYPSATNKDISERGLSEAGLAQILATAQSLSTVAIDYSPLTNCQEDQKKDVASKDKQIRAQKFAEEAYSGMRGIGFTSFGSAVMMIMVATVAAQQEGVSQFKIARPLNDALGATFKNAAENIKAAEEAAISALCQQMGISRKEALKYVKNFKEMKKRGDL